MTAVPAGYDEAHAASWTYHRNGICGSGFYATVEDDTLHVAWGECDDEHEVYPVAASIPLAVLRGFAQLPAVGATVDVSSKWNRDSHADVRHVVAVADGRPAMHVFDLAETWRGEPALAGRMLVVSDPTDDDRDRYAAFVLTEVLAGDASTTLRGDNLYSDGVTAAAQESSR